MNNTFGKYSNNYFYSLFKSSILSLSTSYNLFKILTTSKFLYSLWVAISISFLSFFYEFVSKHLKKV